VTDSDQDIFDVGLELMERAFDHRNQRVRLIGIGVSSLVDDGMQLSLLDSARERMGRLDPVIDGIRNRYGFTAIQRGRTLWLKDFFSRENGDYLLETPALSR